MEGGRGSKGSLFGSAAQLNQLSTLGPAGGSRQRQGAPFLRQGGGSNPGLFSPAQGTAKSTLGGSGSQAHQSNLFGDACLMETLSGHGRDSGAEEYYKSAGGALYTVAAKAGVQRPLGAPKKAEAVFKKRSSSKSGKKNHSAKKRIGSKM